MDWWTYFITWNTYGTWLPGDVRGWRKRKSGQKIARPLLAAWCKEQMRYPEVVLSEADRKTVKAAIHQHCEFRGWDVLAANPRSNHVHLVVVANAGPKTVRDQLKANCTRELRCQEIPLNVPQTWAKGGDTEILDTDEEISAAVAYVLEAQDVNLRR